MQSLPPEIRLFLLCGARAANGDAIHEAARHPSLDWRQFSALVHRDHASPVVWRRLAEFARAAIPKDVADALARAASVTEFRLLYLQHRLAESATALAEAGVQAVALKGAALAAGVYGAFTERSMVDLDVLVPRARVPEALDALHRVGWSSPTDREWWKADYHHLPPLIDRRGLTSLELHTEVLGTGHPFRFSAAMVLDGATPVASGSALAIPTLEHLLVHSCVHFLWQHMGRTHAWRAFRDVAAIAAAPDLDWERLVTLTRDARAATCCYWTLSMARALFGADVPQTVIAALRPSVPAPLHALLARHLVLAAFPTGVDCPSARLRRALWSLTVLPERSGHGDARPWTLLVMPEEEREQRGVAAAEAQRAARGARGRATDLFAYGRRLLLGA